MNYSQRIEAALGKEGVEAITSKLVIHDGERPHDIYVKTGWWRGYPIWVDVTISRSSNEGMTDSLDLPIAALPLVVNLRRRITENTRALVEIVCREATLLLSSRRCSLEELADMWRATEAEPKGKCGQVVDDCGDRVHGPLDAAAKLFKLKAAEWEKKMAHKYDDEEVDTMISDCQAALESNPDAFTGFERTFIESVSDANETTHLSNKQIEKLEQIWEDRCG
jgi:hypothetical protein